VQTPAVWQSTLQLCVARQVVAQVSARSQAMLQLDPLSHVVAHATLVSQSIVHSPPSQFEPQATPVHATMQL
jgi:hypothetical protein